MRITFGGRTVEGVVKLASPNGKSIFVTFEALLGGYAGQMPVLLEEDGVYRDLIMRQPVTLEESEKTACA